VSLNDEMARQTNERDAYEYRQHMRTQLACARARAEAWHHAARKWRRLERYAFDILRRIEPASERQAQAAIATAAREFVRLYGDGGVSKGETREMLAALDRLREVVGGER
jgi:hypothetical protein